MNEKTATLTEIRCQLSDCIFYQAHDRNPEKALCSHKDAVRYVHSDPPCPLYRLDWQKKMNASQHLFKPAPRKKIY